MLANLQQDLEPVGTLEKVLVEKIAQEYWQLSVAARQELEELAINKPFSKTAVYALKVDAQGKMINIPSASRGWRI